MGIWERLARHVLPDRYFQVRTRSVDVGRLHRRLDAIQPRIEQTMEHSTELQIQSNRFAEELRNAWRGRDL